MFTKLFRALTALVVLTTMAALVPTGFALAQDADIALVSVMRQQQPVTYHLAAGTDVASFDPQMAQDSISIDAIENLFLGLTNTDPTTPGNILPELASAWTVSDDGTVWTFTVRGDVPWVRWNPVTDEGEVVRNVTAGDIAYGMKRACDPRLGSYYTSVADKVVLGCNEVSTKPAEEVTDADYDLVQVSAPDDTTLVVNLQFSAGYFFSMTPMWMFRPVPREVIEEYGTDWTEPGNMVVNGPFVLDEYVRGVRWVYMKNPYLPADLRGPGNVERVEATSVADTGTAYALYQSNKIDRANAPTGELQAILQDPALSKELSQVPTLNVGYFGFAYDKPPFDNVHARRAFAASVDRNAYVQQALQGRGLPMIHFAPPGMFGAVPINEVGVGYNPEYARQEIEAAGYPNCQGFPNITMVVPTGAGPDADFLSAAVERELGCDPNLMTLEQQEWTVFLQTIDPRNEPADRPNLWGGSGWGPDYPDENNWVGDVLGCEAENSFKRPCVEVDDLIAQAARENDPDVRIELYARIEEAFFGAEGEHPIIPLAMWIDYVLTKPWISGPFNTDGIFGGNHLDWRIIDQAAQLAARGE